MRLGVIRGGTKKELESRQYNLGIGISLGNKWFTAENILELTKWALPRTRENVIIYVADSIHAINLEVRGRLSSNKAREKAKRLGEEILTEVKGMVENSLPKEEAARIMYATWQDLHTASYQKKVAFLYQVFDSNRDFANSIKMIVSRQLAKESRVFEEKDVEKLATYILEELPECISRVPIQGYACDAFIYPYDGELAQFIDDLQKGVVFPQVKEFVMDTEPKVFLEVR